MVNDRMNHITFTYKKKEIKKKTLGELCHAVSWFGYVMLRMCEIRKLKVFIMKTLTKKKKK